MLSNRPTLLHRSTKMFKIQDPDGTAKRVLSTMTITRSGAGVVVKFLGVNMPEAPREDLMARMRRQRMQR